MKKVIILLVAITAVLNVFSQQLFLTPKVGISYFEIKNIDQFFQPDVYQLNPGIGFQAGVEVGVEGKFLTFQSGLLFTQKGYIKQVYNITYQERYNFLEIPLLLKASYGLEYFKGYALIGPYFAYCINGKSLKTVERPGEISANEKNLDLNANYSDSILSNSFQKYNYDLNRYDIGLNYGIGISIKHGSLGGIIELRKSNGYNDYKIYDVNPPDRKKETHNSLTIFAGISYFFKV